MLNKTTIVIMLPINKPHRLDAPFFAPFFFVRRPYTVSIYSIHFNKSNPAPDSFTLPGTSTQDMLDQVIRAVMELRTARCE